MRSTQKGSENKHIVLIRRREKYSKAILLSGAVKLRVYCIDKMVGLRMWGEKNESEEAFNVSKDKRRQLENWKKTNCKTIII